MPVLNGLESDFGSEVESNNRNERAKQLITIALNRLKDKINQRIPEATRRELEDPLLRHNLCHIVNGGSVIEMMNAFKVPGIAYRVDVNKASSPLLEKSWAFHVVGLFCLDDNSEDENALYAVIDQTTIDPTTGEYFIATGTLDEIQKTTEKTFGGFWEFKKQLRTSAGKTFSVQSKMKGSAELIEQDTPVNFDTHMYTYHFDSQTQKPLGIRANYMLNSRIPVTYFETI
ncbi:hypothetical protein KBD71_04970 [Candidatus Woesebacteria bacterium]|nr:hypothetical protein [Candidatus Woesebacteria bacterium]